MKSLKDLEIGTQLLVGLSAILGLVLSLGALAWVQTDLLWEDTRSLYTHPVEVRRVTGDLRANVLAISREMKDICLGASEGRRDAHLRRIDTLEADAQRQFSVLFDRYLGPREDVDAALRSLVQWRPIRAGVLQLLQDGQTAEAAARTRDTGVGGAHAEKLLGQVRHISEFASVKTEEFYRSATQRRESLRRQLAIVLAAIVLLCLGVSYLLLRGIRGPLLALTAAADEFRQGKLDARCEYASAGELGTLAATFNALAETAELELTFRQRLADLNAVMLRDLGSTESRQHVLEALMRVTGSQMGATYLLDEQQTAYEHLESIGLGGAARASFSASEREGEFGAALASGELQHIAQIPEDTRFTFAAVSGDFRPREILTLPLCSGTQTPAVISLASVRGYDAAALRLVTGLQAHLATWMSSMLAHRKLKTATARLEQQNRELDIQKRDLTLQASELGEQNAELEQQRNQIEQANQHKSTFLSTMSHELRTPLNSVIALSGVLRRRLSATIPEEERGYLEVIERNGRHLLMLINDVLDLARIEAGREELTVERFSVKELVAELVEMLEPQARDKAVALVSTLGDDVPLVRSDRGKCRHVLQNLLGNAVKFTDVGRVEISTSSTASELRLSVTDTGVGIARDQLESIFDEFRQADEGPARQHGGTGLGLAIAKKYAALLRGSLEVASTPGQGSTFTFTLPLTLDPGRGARVSTELVRASVSAAAQSAPPTGHGTSGRLLLVDDNEPAIIQMNDILAGQGYKVRVARGGREALAQLDAWLPDAVVLDLMMPLVDGFAVLKAMRSADRTRQVPVLILTAKHVTREELSFLQGNRIHQLVQKGTIGRVELLAAVAAMMLPPAAEPEPSAPSALPPAVRRPRSTHPSRPGRPLVLVVEDNPDNLLTARAVLQDDYEVIEATDGRNGVAQAQVHLPDIVLMDISLPMMDGIEALRAMRAEERLCNVPVIALTASALKGNREEILSHGFDGYVAKPIDAAVLLDTIQGMLNADA